MVSAIWVAIVLSILIASAITEILGNHPMDDELGVLWVAGRVAGNVIKLTLAMLLLTSLRAWDTWAHATFLRHVLPLQQRAAYHCVLGWVIAVASVVHVFAHLSVENRGAMTWGSWVGLEGGGQHRRVVRVVGGVVGGVGRRGWTCGVWQRRVCV